ncbi:hypothetical protein ACT3R3_15790, partial [Glutamicibacter sp. AOP5-B1-3]
FAEGPKTVIYGTQDQLLAPYPSVSGFAVFSDSRNLIPERYFPQSMVSGLRDAADFRFFG